MVRNRRRETTDGRYVEVGNDEWWDTTGIDLVSEAIVELHMIVNPGVGIVVL